MKNACLIVYLLFLILSSNAFALVGNAVKEASEKYEAIGQINEGCTATLITKKILITAAHCVMGKSPSDLKIKFMNLSKEVEVSRIIIPNYIRFTSPIGRGQDIAVLEIKEEITKIRPILLGLNTLTQLGAKVTLAGYGRFQIQNDKCFGDSSKKLLVGDSQINTIIDKFPENDWGAELETEGANTSVCGGDSGGPALLEINNELYVVGIISNGSYNQDTVLSLISGASDYLISSIEKIEHQKSDSTLQKFNVLETDWVSPVLSGLDLAWQNKVSDNDTCELTIGFTKNQPFDFNKAVFESIYETKIVPCEYSITVDKGSVEDALKENNLKIMYEAYPIGTLPQFLVYENIATLTLTLKNLQHADMRTLQANCTYYLNSEKVLTPVRQDYGHHCSMGFLTTP